MGKTIAVVVHACDRYALLYRGFEYFFKKHWPAEVAINNYYFLTEEADTDSTFFKNIKTGMGEWSDRLENALKKIPED